MESKTEISTALFGNDSDAFDVTVLRTESASRYVVFAAGRGGNPSRHLGLLQTFVGHGMTVFAPHFDMLASFVPTKAELMERSRRLAEVMRRLPAGLPIAGVGHSIGSVLLLMLAGAEISTLAGDRLTSESNQLFDRLVLFTPPADFFRRPGSLASVNVPIQVWAGGKDAITPPGQAEFLKETLKEKTRVDLHVVEDAGHFTFMNELPPQVTDPHPDRDAFLVSLGEEATRFLSTSNS